MDKLAHQRHERAGLQARDLLLGLVVYLALQVLVGGGVVVGFATGAVAPDVGDLVVLLAGSASAFPAALFVLARCGWSWSSVGVRPTTGPWLAVGLAIGLVGWAAVRLVSVTIQALTGQAYAGSPIVSVANSVEEFLCVLLVIGVVVPIGEEMLFRGVLHRWLITRFPRAALGISSVAFGVVHGGSAVVFVGTTLLGVVFALLYERSGSIWPSVLAHTANNVMVLGLAWFVT